MLKAHMDAIEKFLIAYAEIQENTGHSLHKGTPREFFVNEFLKEHLSENASIGTGEIIDADSKPGERRNQMDVIVYRKEFPKLAFGGGVSGFLVESVVATLEVKSTLTEKDLGNAMAAARNVKKLRPNLIQSFRAGAVPPGVLSYVVAYDGPAKMATVQSWIASICAEQGITYPDLPLAEEQRIKVVAPALDAVFVLGKGFVYYDNAFSGFLTDEARTKHPTRKWCVADAPTGALLYLFLLLTQAMSNIPGSWLNPFPYLKTFMLRSGTFAVED